MIILFCVFIFLLGCFLHYKIWRWRLIRKLNKTSRLIKTSVGMVEYISIGFQEGPILFVSHGGGSGYDNAFLYDFLADEGFRIICPSRPGYLRTPLEAGRTFEEHADMFASLLDALEIKKKVAILGISLGGGRPRFNSRCAILSA